MYMTHKTRRTRLDNVSEDGWTGFSRGLSEASARHGRTARFDDSGAKHIATSARAAGLMNAIVFAEKKTPDCDGSS